MWRMCFPLGNAYTHRHTIENSLTAHMLNQKGLHILLLDTSLSLSLVYVSYSYIIICLYMLLICWFMLLFFTILYMDSHPESAILLWIFQETCYSQFQIPSSMARNSGQFPHRQRRDSVKVTCFY